ncbi:Uncharacterised protein [Mycobacterium tuberculosis]|nr:Uncharacterised protein [Mycobacterium tuberculosis]
MIPNDMSATPRRSTAKLARALSRPSPSAQSRRSGVSRTLSKNNSPVGEDIMPIFLNGLPCVRPGMPASSTKTSTGRLRQSEAGSPSASLA